MLLATRCPFCETVFRLLPAQLTLRRGLVRCGHCHEVFDASSSLYDLSNGVSFANARPVTADDVAALAAGEAEPQPAAAGHATEPAHQRSHKPAAVHQNEAEFEPVAEAAGEPAVAEHEAAVESAAERAYEAPASFAATDEAQPSTAPRIDPLPPIAHDAPAESTTSADATEPASEPFNPPSTAPGAGPDFRAEAWDPWAPAPDALVDRRIRHNASSIPYNPVTIPSSAQPPLTLELTDTQPLNLEKATAPKQTGPQPLSPVEHVVAPDFQASPEPALEQDFVEPPPQTWRHDEPSIEPEHVPAAVPVNEAALDPLRDPLHEPPPEPTLLHAHDSSEAHTQAERDAAVAEASEPSLENDDRTLIPSAEPEHDRDDGRLREPYFSTPSTEPDLEPRFGATPAEPYGEPKSGPNSEPFAAAPLHDDDPFAVTREPRAAEPKRLGWRIAGGFVAGLLLALLLAQLAWWQRETVMVNWPDSQSIFAHACQRLGCTVAPPRAIDGLLVEPSDLRQVDGPHKLELRMPLRNRFDLALAYPAVELTLLDEHNNIAVRRVLWPQDYVKPGTPIAAGLPARTTQTMIVRLDTGDAVASNFRVQIFYP